MMQSDPFQQPYPCLDYMDLYLLECGMDADMDYFEFSPPFTQTNNSSSPDTSIISNFPTLSEDRVNFCVDGNEMDLAFSTLNFQDLESILNGEVEDMSAWLTSSEENFSPCDASMDVASIQFPLTLPTEDMEIDNGVSVDHLLRAVGEAMENEQGELAEVIKGRIIDKVSPIGEIGQRIAYYAFQSLDKQADYLKQESVNNFDLALEAFYTIFPFGMMAHFTANSAILEAKPSDAEVLQVVDFDMGDGIQWSSMIMAFAQQQRQRQHSSVPQQMTLKLTSIKWTDENNCGHVSSPCAFDKTKRRLLDYAKSFGLKLRVEEMELHDLVNDVKRTKKRGGRKEWVAFNCMWGLPHMGRTRSRRRVMEFLMTAKDLLANSGCSNTHNNGIITFGDGDAWDKLRHCSGFGSFFDGYMDHYRALLESIECNFPISLPVARITMESLFVAPYVSCEAWKQRWEGMKEGSTDFRTGLGLKGLRLAAESLLEAKEMAREGQSLFQVRIEGENGNEMVLEWRGTELVRISAWT